MLGNMLALRFTCTATSVPVFNYASAENERGCTFGGNETKFYLFDVSITIRNPVGVMKLKRDVLSKCLV